MQFKPLLFINFLGGKTCKIASQGGRILSSNAEGFSCPYRQCLSSVHAVPFPIDGNLHLL